MTIRYAPYPRYMPGTLYDPIPRQAEGTYLDYKKIKGFEDVGFFLKNYVVSGGIVTKNLKKNDQVDVSEIVVVMNNDVQKRDGTSFDTKYPNMTYYLDFANGDFAWGTTHPTGVLETDWIPIAEVTTDEHGNVQTISDKAEPRGGFRLKSEYGLFDYGIVASGVVTVDQNPNYDNSEYLNNLIASVPSGSKIIIPRGKIKANIVVSRSDIIIEHTTGGDLPNASYIYPFDKTKPCFAIVGQNSHVRGVTIYNLTLLGTFDVNDTQSHGLYISGARDINFVNLKVEYFGGSNIHLTSGSLFTSYIYFEQVKSRYSRGTNFYIEKGNVYTTAVYLNNVQFAQNTLADPGVNVILSGGSDLYISNAWIQAHNLRGIFINDSASRLFANNVYIDSDNSNDVLVKQLNSSRPQIYGSYIVDGFVELANGTSYKPSSLFVDGFNRTVWREIVISDTVNFTDVLELGANASYKITVALSDSSNDANMYAFVEVFAVCDSANVTKQMNEILNSPNKGIDVRWKNDTNGSFAADNDRRILQLRTRYSLADRWIIRVEIFARNEYGARPNVKFL